MRAADGRAPSTLMRGLGRARAARGWPSSSVGSACHRPARRTRSRRCQAKSRWHSRRTATASTAGCRRARRAGHEILLQLPLEPFDYPSVDPGRDTLTVAGDPHENTERLLRTLARITNYVGVMNYMGARFTSDEAVMSPLMAELGRRGLMFLDDGTSARSIADRLAQGNGRLSRRLTPRWTPTATAPPSLSDLTISNASPARQGYAIGTGSAFDTTVETVASWVAEARRRGVEIVPVSALANDPGR